MKVSVIQMNSGEEIALNLDTAARLASECAEQDRPDLIALPEYFSFIAASPDALRRGAKQLLTSEVEGFLAGLARELGVAIRAGSSLLLDGDKVFNQSQVFDREGNRIATYRKIHLFDTVLPGGKRLFESDTISRGEELALYDIAGTRFGCSICFDLRFPEHYARLVARGAKALLVPSAFTHATGADHWEVLLRARAIETQCYVIAPAQVFSFGGGQYANWGHSMIVDPWGAVVAQVSNHEGFATATLSEDFVEAARARIPMERNRYWKSAP